MSVGDFRPVRDAQDASLLGAVGDSDELRDADLLRVGLDNVQSTAIDEALELSQCRQAFAGGDGLGTYRADGSLWSIDERIAGHPDVRLNVFEGQAVILHLQRR